MFILCAQLLISIPKAVLIFLLSKTLKLGRFAGVGKLVVGIGSKFILILLISNIFFAKSYQEHCPSLEKL